MEGIEKVCQFLDDAQTYYLATVDGDQPRVRPFGTALLWGGKLYIQTGKVKDVSKQIAANPKVEISAFKDGKWSVSKGTYNQCVQLNEHDTKGWLRWKSKQ